MPKIFCPECGNKHEFSDKRPKFCTECGWAFEGTSSKTKPVNPVEVETYIEESDYNVPRFDPSDFIINKNVLTVGQSMASPLPPSNFSRPGVGKRGLSELQKRIAKCNRAEL